jgi:hypothetical protein
MRNLSLNLENSVMSREEMRFIAGGNELRDSPGGWCSDACQTDSDCPDGMMGQTSSCRTGTCDSSPTKMCFLNP